MPTRLVRECSGNYSNTLVAKINFSFHQGSSNEVMVTPFEEDTWINLLFPTYIPEWVMKRCDSYVPIKKTRSPFISPSIPDIIFPYLACSSALWGRRMPYLANTVTSNPEQSMHFMVVPPIQ